MHFEPKAVWFFEKLEPEPIEGILRRFCAEYLSLWPGVSLSEWLFKSVSAKREISSWTGSIDDLCFEIRSALGANAVSAPSSCQCHWHIGNGMINQYFWVRVRFRPVANMEFSMDDLRAIPRTED